MSSNTTTKYSGPGLATLLTVLFVGLKLTGHIAWSWWWVLSPLWITAALVLAVVMVFIGIAVIVGKSTP